MATKGKRGRPPKPESENLARAAIALAAYNKAIRKRRTDGERYTDRQAKDYTVKEVKKAWPCTRLSKSEIERQLRTFQPVDQSDAFLFEEAKPGELDAWGRRVLVHMKIGPRPMPPKRKRKPFRF